MRVRRRMIDVCVGYDVTWRVRRVDTRRSVCHISAVRCIANSTHARPLHSALLLTSTRTSDAVLSIETPQAPTSRRRRRWGESIVWRRFRTIVRGMGAQGRPFIPSDSWLAGVEDVVNCPSAWSSTLGQSPNRKRVLVQFELRKRTW